MNALKHWLYRRSVRAKLSATLFAVVTLFALLVSVINTYTQKSQTDKVVIEFIELNLRSNEDFMVKALMANDYWSVYRFLRSLSHNGFINDIGFVDENGIIIAHTDTQRYQSGDRYLKVKNGSNIYTIPLKNGDANLGNFVMHINKEFAHKLLSAPLKSNIVLLVLAAMVSILLGVMITNRITGRLAVLESNVKAVTEKRWGDIHIPQWREQDEITGLVQNVALVMGKIQKAIENEEELKEFYHRILSTLDMLVVIMDEERQVIYHNDHPMISWALNHNQSALGEDLRAKLSECSSSVESAIPCTSKIHETDGDKTILIKSQRIGEYYVISFADVTQMQQLEKHIGLSRSLSLVGEFSAQFTHEIKNLLQPMKLLLGDPKQCDEEDLVFISKMVSKIDDKVLRYLEIGRPVDKGMSVVLNCEESIQKTLFILSSRIEELSLVLEQHINPNVNVFMAENAFEALLLDLISNAIEASYLGGMISISALSDTGNMSCIRIEDNGEGIDPTLQEKIFDPFFTTKERGSGFGLFNVYRSVYQHGGFIDLKSTLGHTRFDIYLPNGENV